MVRALRQESGLTQEMLADRVGITKNQLQLIEAGRSASGNQGVAPSNPRMTTVFGIADAFDLSVEQLMAESRL
ncbi:helix-turn-helix domain-containing protein [Zhihengliuella sp. ISTPL4]|uniref:helix-turn-helix domain-containing protein n=1 Tax=Zhihengliuella sp. ISTPL4 TaxID=2058657 RepID=UPI0018F21C57|nr:helix-turn-helix transcriptional regulator [Zhihengliuella sp. ISTPL4]